MRIKVPLAAMPYLSEAECGIPDSILADFMRFDLVAPPGPDGKRHAVISIAFCPWCGKRREYGTDTRVTDIHHGAPDEESGEAWKRGEA
jgi:hypothetical protein